MNCDPTLLHFAVAKNVQVDKSMIRGAEDGLIEDVQSSYRRIHDLDLRPSNTKNLGPRTLDLWPWT